MGVQWSLALAKEYEQKGISIEVLDLRTLLPLDKEAIIKTVKKTGKVLLVQEATLTLGPASELSAIINEECFEWLDAPVLRCASLDTPIPHHKRLERGFIAEYDLDKKLKLLTNY